MEFNKFCTDMFSSVQTYMFWTGFLKGAFTVFSCFMAYYIYKAFKKYQTDYEEENDYKRSRRKRAANIQQRRQQMLNERKDPKL